MEEVDISILDEDDIEVALELLVEEQKKASEDSYFTFFQYAWDVLEPETLLIQNWHVKYICDLLQNEIERIADRRPKTKDIIINIPPRSLKSRIASVMLPAWAWTKYPWIKFIYASYSEKLSIDQSIDCRRLIQSDWYQERWRPMFKLTSDQNVKGYFTNNKGGFRLASSVHGTITGLGADVITCDDILDPQQSESEVERNTANMFYSRTLHSRLNDQKVGLRLIVMQRLHEDDVTGYVLSNFKDSYTHIKLPIQLEGGDDEVVPLSVVENYTKLQSYQYPLFFPERFDKEVIDAAKRSLGEYGFAGQMMQNPSPAVGGMFKKHYWNYWKPKGITLPDIVIKNEKGDLITKRAIDLPDNWEEKVYGWDMTFKDTDGTDFVVGQKWGRIDQYKFVLEQLRDRMDFPTTVNAVRERRFSDNKISAVYVEDKANGSAVIAQLKREVPGLIPVSADTSKTSRAMPILRQAEAGNIFLPHPALFDWVKDFIEEYAKFPLGKHDDMVDCGSHCVNKMSEIKIRVINGFEKNSPKHFRDFDLNLKERSHHDKLYAVIYQEKNNRISIIMAVWESSAAHLYVFAEHVNLNPMPEVVLSELLKITKKYNVSLKDFDWWCNEVFDGKPESSSTSDAYNAFSLFPQSNPFFDRFGSILTINQMFMRNAITINKSCVSTADQMNEWYQDGDINSDILDYDKNKGCVMALCHLSGILIQHKKVAPVKLKEYDVKKIDIARLSSNAIQSGDFTGFGQGFQNLPEVGKKDTEWMGV